MFKSEKLCNCRQVFSKRGEFMKEIEELSGLLDREGIQNLGKELGLSLIHI